MNFDNVKNVPCVGAKEVIPDKTDADVIVTPDETVPRKCIPGEDMEYAALAGESYCTNAPTFGDLVIEPAENAEVVELVGTKQFTAYLYFVYKDSNSQAPNTPGKSYRIDVTNRATWSSGEPNVASHEGGGSFKGKSVAADKQININASYTPSAVIDGVKVTHNKTLTASAKLKVKDTCIDTAIDIVLVVDRSGSMLRTDEPNETKGKTRLESVKEACIQLVESSKAYSEKDLVHIEGNPNSPLNTGRTADADGKLREVDRIAIVTYAGIDHEYPAAEVHAGFDSTKQGVIENIRTIAVAHQCGNEDTPSHLLAPDPDTLPEGVQPVEGCWTGMGAGLQLAYELLQEDVDTADGTGKYPGTRGKVDKDWPRKLIVLLTDGYENVCYPDPEAVVTEIKGDRKGVSGATIAHDTMIYTIGFMVDSTQAMRRCNGQTMTASSYLGTLANCYSNSNTSLTAFPQSSADLTSVYEKLLNLLCKDNLGGNSGANQACHYIDNSGMSRVSGPAAKNLSVGYSWEKWANWVVCKNTVDKMGVDSFNSINPSEGTMVGLIGNQGLRLLRGEPGDKGSQLVAKEDFSDDWKGRECQQYYAPYDHNFGGIELRNPVTFTKGKEYKLTLKLGGNTLSGRGNFTHGIDVGSSVRISIGGTQAGLDAGERAMEVPYDDANDSYALTSFQPAGTSSSFPALVTRKLITPLPVGSSSEYKEVRNDKGAVFIVTIEPDAPIKEYVFEFIPEETQTTVVRIEQFPAKYAEAVKSFSHEMKDKDVTSMLDEAERYYESRPNCSIQKKLDISWFSGFSTFDTTVVYDSGEYDRHMTSGADEFLAPVPFGIVLSNATLTEDGQAVDTFCDNGTETFSD
tara:strand:+ start:2353 stop:4923 length:2571 start_codon:yes stop_codon:yes gene_type:complete